jgi:DMSO reductase family type II enzyme chaperone
MAAVAIPVSPDIHTARCAVYRFLRAALDKPTVEQHGWLASAAFRRQLEELASHFGVEVPAGELVPAEVSDHEARYIACFEVGLPEPPVVLLASHWNHREPVPAIIHEHKLFYNRFGAAALMDAREPADHLLNELTFLIHLDELLLDSRRAAESLLRGRRDFLARHPARWSGQAAETARDKRLPGIYGTLLAVLTAAITQDLELTEAALTTESGRDP